MALAPVECCHHQTAVGWLVVSLQDVLALPQVLILLSGIISLGGKMGLSHPTGCGLCEGASST